MGVIYIITSPSNKKYVGQTTDFRKRLNHYRSLKFTKQKMLFASFKKHGFDAHKFDILEDNLPCEMLNERERYWIEKLGTYNKFNKMGMNLNKGGCNVWSKEAKEKFGKKLTGENNPFFGKTHTLENRKLFSDNAKIQFKGHTPSKKAIENSAIKKRRAVVVYDNTGQFIFEFISLTECAKKLHIDTTTVRDSLNGMWIRKQYIVKYKTDNYQLKIEVQVSSTFKPVYYFFNSHIIEYPSCKATANELGVCEHTIRTAAKKGIPTRKTGYLIQYKDLWEQRQKTA